MERTQKTFMITYLNKTTNECLLMEVIKTKSKTGDEIEFLGTEKRYNKIVAGDVIGKVYKLSEVFA